MSVSLVPYALTTVAKVKLALGSTDSSNDDTISMMINNASAFIQSFTGRKFLSQAYTEVKDTYNSDKIFLNQKPVTAIASVSYRSGLISNPVWNVYDANSYWKYLDAGYLRFTARFKAMPQFFQVVYTAGYLIDFDHETDPTKHTLPFDLTQAATDIVAKKFNTRQAAGIVTETTEGQSITFGSSSDVSAEQKTILNSYKLIRVAV